MTHVTATKPLEKTITNLPSGNLLQRKCACGNHTIAGGECADCCKKRLQRKVTNHTQPGTVPPIVYDVLHSPGQPLDSATRAFMETRFGHAFSQVHRHNGTLPTTPTGLVINPPGDRYEQDANRTADTIMYKLEPVTTLGSKLGGGFDFSRVRIHSDAVAEQSARELNAHAYTVGHNIVFGAGQFATGTIKGRRLIAHELTHVVQQERGLSTGMLQREERRPRPAPVDADAQRIIDLAQDSTTPIEQRAVAVVRAIINQYFSDDASKINGINYRASEQGLKINYVGRGATTTGTLDVGSYFVENTTQRRFARRVLQVRHEIEHIEQVRSGMAGESRSDEREFIAYYHEALAQELPGTGRMQHSTRVILIDGALGYYYCLATELQSANVTRRDELVTRRTEEVRRSNRTDLGQAPTTCRRQPGDRRQSRQGAQSEGLSGAAIAGIALGAVAGAAAIGVGIAALAGAF